MADDVHGIFFDHIDIGARIALHKRFGRSAPEFVHGEVAAEIVPPIAERFIGDKDVLAADKKIEIFIIPFGEIGQAAYAPYIRLHAHEDVYAEFFGSRPTLRDERGNFFSSQPERDVRKAVIGDADLFEPELFRARRIFFHGALPVRIGRVRMIIRC